MNEKRWSDDKLEAFYQEFKKAQESDTKEKQQQEQLYQAIFRLEDKSLGVPPGLLQLTSQINVQLAEMQRWNEKQKTFAGGVVFTLSAVWFFITDVGHHLYDIAKRIFS